MFDGVSGQLGRCMDIEPFHERALMELHSLGRDLEESGNLFHRAPLGDELEHLPLTGGQRTPREEAEGSVVTRNRPGHLDTKRPKRGFEPMRKPRE